ncbi:MAG: DUF4302 domain-containing protein, partial [Paludibacteraceae bacterium]|nr:DUF4302 domain-containing protein [Paludibacteraceae bacterium]
FCANGEVKAQMAKSAKKLVRDTASVWGIVDDICPILTFNTYNNILHTWADPQTDGMGMEGDYEFLIMEAKPEIVRLKGKKYGAYSVLYPVGADYDPLAAYKDCETMTTSILGNNNLLTYTEGSTQYQLHSDGSTFTLSQPGVLPEDDALSIPFAVLTDGVQIMNTISGENNTNRRFTMGSDGLLHSQTATISAGNYYQHFLKYMELRKMGWSWDMNKNIPAGLADTIAQINEELRDKAQQQGSKRTAKILRLHLTYNEDEIYGEKIVTYLMELKYTDKTKESGLFFYKFDVTFTDDSFTIKYVGPNIKTGEEAKYERMAATVPTLFSLFNNLSGTYHIVPGSALNPALGGVLEQIENPDIKIDILGSAK